MKPPPLLATVGLLWLVFTACRAPATTPPRPLPLDLGHYWVYENLSQGLGDRRAFTTTEAVCRLRPDPPDTLYLVATCSETDLVQTSVLATRRAALYQPLVITRDGQPRPRQPPEPLLPLDLQVGLAWEWQGTLGQPPEPRHHRYIVANWGRVLVPAGEFEAWRVLVSELTEPTLLAHVERWYAPGIGLVRERSLILGQREGQPFRFALSRALREYGRRPVQDLSCCQRLAARLGEGD